jgi:hypothetical protein
MATDATTRPAAPDMTRCAAILRHYAPLLAEHGLTGATDAADYITRPGYGYRYDADNPLSDLAARIGRKGARLAGAHRRNYRTTVVYQVGEARGRAGDLLMDIGNSLVSVMTGGQPWGRVATDVPAAN